MERYFAKIENKGEKQCVAHSNDSKSMGGNTNRTNSVYNDEETSPESSDSGERTEITPKRKYVQKTRNAWLKDKRFEPWITVDGDVLFCKFCNCKLRSKLCGLLEHMASTKHIAASDLLSRGAQPKVPFKATKTIRQVKEAEMSNALYIASHTAIRSVDHLTMLQKKSFSDSEIAAEVKLGRSKCSALIRKVLSPYFKNRLLADIGGNSFSLLIDESTDICINKHLGIVIRYFSRSTKSIVNTFLKLADIEELTAQGIVNAVLNVLQEFDLDIKNLQGLGTDNASVMVGVNRRVITLLKQKNPNIILVPCVCHSIQLAVSSASKLIPSEIEFLVSETYNWFSKSSSRQKSYSAIYAALNDGNEPLKVVRACETRWLSVEVAVTRILHQWLELKTQFKIASTVEYCHKAKVLVALYNEVNLAYLLFLKPILNDLQKANKLFESNIVDPLKVFKD